MYLIYKSGTIGNSLSQLNTSVGCVSFHMFLYVSLSRKSFVMFEVVTIKNYKIMLKMIFGKPLKNIIKFGMVLKLLKIQSNMIYYLNNNNFKLPDNIENLQLFYNIKDLFIKNSFKNI
ncbi:hypothetical protein ACTFIT_008255 [Dictyostelium discoideum]